MSIQRRYPTLTLLVLALGGCGRLELASGTTREDDDGPGPSGGAETPPSCVDAAFTCGDGDDCCAGLYVPMGTFQIAAGLDSRVLPTTVSSFYLDKYEVTLGRFGAFLRDYDAWLAAGNPKEGAGAYQWSRDLGWQSRWQNALLPNAAELEAAITTCNGAPLSTLGAPNRGEDTPVNCITWHEALAFCIWDDARLPTEAEWMNAATGGSYNRVYPWGNEPPPSPSYAVYNCSNSGQINCTVDQIPGVGSKPLGAGRWKHLDLAGSLAEWVADGGSAPPFGGANPTNIEDERVRVLRGGDWMSLAIGLQIGQRTLSDPGLRNHIWGIRCARENPGSRL